MQILVARVKLKAGQKVTQLYKEGDKVKLDDGTVGIVSKTDPNTDTLELTMPETETGVQEIKYKLPAAEMPVEKV